MVTNCKFCNRLLKNENSQERGFGLTCGRKNDVIKIKRRRGYINLFEK